MKNRNKRLKCEGELSKSRGERHKTAMSIISHWNNQTINMFISIDNGPFWNILPPPLRYFIPKFQFIVRHNNHRRIEAIFYIFNILYRKSLSWKFKGM